MQNSITELRIKVPSLAKEVRRIEEDNTRLLYEIEAFESPENLLKLASMPEYSHLRHPISADVLTCKVESSGRGADRLFPSRNKRPTVTFATGVNP